MNSLKELEKMLIEKFAHDYFTTNKSSKSKIINLYCETTGVDRKTAQKRFRRYVIKHFLTSRLHINFVSNHFHHNILVETSD